jgi:hypothetical protein
MIADWRAKFELSFNEFSFLFVQLAAYTQSVETNFVALPQLRYAQMSALIMSHVGMATAIDLVSLMFVINFHVLTCAIFVVCVFRVILIHRMETFILEISKL